MSVSVSVCSYVCLVTHSAHSEPQHVEEWLRRRAGLSRVECTWRRDTEPGQLTVASGLLAADEGYAECNVLFG